MCVCVCVIVSINCSSTQAYLCFSKPHPFSHAFKTFGLFGVCVCLLCTATIPSREKTGTELLHHQKHPSYLLPKKQLERKRQPPSPHTTHHAYQTLAQAKEAWEVHLGREAGDSSCLLISQALPLIELPPLPQRQESTPVLQCDVFAFVSLCL